MTLVPPPPPRLEDLPRGTRLVAGLGYATIIPDLDFETFSAAGYVWNEAAGKWDGPPGAPGSTKGLPVVGAAIYSADPSCEVLCAAFDLKDGLGRRRWRPGLPPPADLFAYLATGGVIEAVNVGFERWIWENVCVPRMGWPPVHPSQWRCVAAKARAFSLPGSLAKMGEVLRLNVQKDKEGTRLINKFCMPRKPTKGDPRKRVPMRFEPLNIDDLRAGADTAQIAEDFNDTCAMLSYNETDIASEAEASSRIPDLEGEELAWWQVDQAINKRGVHIDLASVENCIAVIEQAMAKYHAELFELTGIDAASKVQQLVGWLRGQSVFMDSLDEDAVEAMLKNPHLTPAARRVLEIRAAVGSASVKKVFAMRNRATAASRMHDLFIYYGARTGRATGEGPQPTNSPKAGPDLVRCGCKRHYAPTLAACPWCGVPKSPTLRLVEWSPDAAEDAIEVLRHRSLQLLESVMGDAMHAIAGCIRGLYDAAPGHDLISTDYNSIEAVGAAMLAGEQWRIDIFRTHGKIYEASAAKAFNVPFEDFAKHKAETGQHHPLRQKGKILELSMSYQGWLGAARAFDFPGTDDEIKAAILAWRDASPAIVWLWGGQTLGTASSIRGDNFADRWDRTPHYFGVEGMAIQAILDPGTEYVVKRLDGTDSGIAFLMRGKTLHCRLPSGRWLTYHDARVEPSERGLSISYWGNNTNPKNGPVGWIEIRTWGGRLVENCIAEGTLVFTSRGWVAIEQVRADDLVHDGVEFVRHAGLVAKGVQPCLPVDHVWMTPDHEVLTDDGWRAAETSPRPYRPTLRDADGVAPRQDERAQTLVGVPLRLRERAREVRGGREERPSDRALAELRLHDEGVDRKGAHHARDEQAPGVRGVAVDERSLPAAVASGVGTVWRAGHSGLRALGRIVRELLAGRGRRVQTRFGDRPDRQQRELRAGQHALDESDRAAQQPAGQPSHTDAERAADVGASLAPLRHRADHVAVPSGEQLADRPTVDRAERREQRVFDILDCGPRSRFVVLGGSGPFIVHNCNQATCRDILRFACINLEARGYPVVLHVYDEIVCEIPEGFGSLEEFQAIVEVPPFWARDWPIRAPGPWRAKRYRKG